MSRIRKGRAAVAVCAIMLVASVVSAGQLVSTMRNVSAVMSSGGYMIRPVPELSGQRFPGDVGFSQAFEIVRPNGEAITLGRLNTSCVCVTITADKKSYAQGERAIIIMKNVKPTPPAGQMYAMYVQLSRPVRVTLRYDTFVKSGFDGASDMMSAGPAITAAAPASAPTVSPTPAPAPETTLTTKEPQTSSTSHPLTVVGDNGIELIIPRWQTEEAEKPESAETPSDAAGPAVTYSKQIVIDEPKPAAKVDEPEEAPEREVMKQGDYSKEIPAETVSRPENVDQIIDKYAAVYKPDRTEDEVEKADE